jgi:hypothetical protein
MGVNGVAELTPQLKLYQWQDPQDLYDHTQLRDNWTIVDTALLKKNFGATANYNYGDYAEKVFFAGTAGLGAVALSFRAGTVTTAGGTSTMSTADVNDRMNISMGGTVSWGNGTSVTDVSLYRNGAGTLSVGGVATSNSLILTGTAGKISQKSSVGTASVVFESQVSTDTFNRFNILSGGTVNWGSGTSAPDTNLYRSDVNILATDDTFLITGGTVRLGSGTVGFVGNSDLISSNNTLAITRSSAGTALNLINSSAGTYPSLNVNSNGSVNWGPGNSSSYDIAMYRSGAGTLTITDTMTVLNGNGSVTGNLSVGGNLSLVGSSIGFFGSAASQSTGWSTGPTNVSSGTKTYNATNVSVNEIAHTLGNLIIALRNYGILGA